MSARRVKIAPSILSADFSRLASEILAVEAAGVELLHVPYKSNPLAVNDLLGGQIDMMITDMATGLPQVKGGKARALGVSTAKRSPLEPNVPTISEAGLKGYDMGFWFAAYAPAGTPAAVVTRLNAILIEASKGPARPTTGSTNRGAIAGPMIVPSPNDDDSADSAATRPLRRVLEAR